jgi:hypothetical protein
MAKQTPDTHKHSKMKKDNKEGMEMTTGKTHSRKQTRPQKKSETH